MTALYPAKRSESAKIDAIEKSFLIFMQINDTFYKFNFKFVMTLNQQLFDVPS